MREIAETQLGSKVKDVVITVPAYFNNSQHESTKQAGVIAGLNVLRIINEPFAAAIAYGIDMIHIGNHGCRNVFIFDLGGGTLDVSISGDPKALRRLKCACEKAKRILSSNSMTTIEIDCLNQGIDFSSPINRAKFDELNKVYFDRCMEIVEKCLTDSGMDKSSIHDVVLVGGSTRIVKVKQLLSDFFEGKELCKSINADEAIAHGAAVYASRLSGKEVIPLSLGVNIQGGIMEIIIPRNSVIPTNMESMFTTTKPNQTAVAFDVYEGERKIAKENNYLGNFRIEIPPATVDVPKIKVNFHIDDDGILHVSITEILNGINKKVTIINQEGRLSKEEIERMIKEAADNKDEDEKYIQKVEARNALENYAYSIRNVINDKEISLKISQEENKSINETIDKVLVWLEANLIPEQHNCDNFKKSLSSVFDPIILKMIKDEDSGVQQDTINEKKKHSTIVLLTKYAFKIVTVITTTGSFIQLVSSAFI